MGFSKSYKVRFFIATLALIGGCSGLVLDPSMKAVVAGDYSLVSSLCEAAPNRGLDACFPQEDTNIYSSWRLIFPTHKLIKGGEVTVYFRDFSKSYPINGAITEIPFRDFFLQDKWTKDLSGEALALASIRYIDPAGLEEIIHFRGIAKIVVLSKGYARLPVDSGYIGFTQDIKCKVFYTTSGRTDYKCE